MQFNPSAPIWMQVLEALEIDIVTGKRQPGEKLPGGRDLALQFSINPNTAARVYQELEKKGLCSTRRGMGTYVTEDTARIFALREEIAGQAVCQFLDTMELHEWLRYVLIKKLRDLMAASGKLPEKAEIFPYAYEFYHEDRSRYLGLLRSIHRLDSFFRKREQR